jgi:hypothetical protein
LSFLSWWDHETKSGRQLRWAYGDSLPASELDAAVANKTIFKNWFENNIIANDSVTCSDSLILYTSGVKILYRNQYTKYVNSTVGVGIWFRHHTL